MLMLLVGCGGTTTLIPYTDEELAQEIFPQNLPAAKPQPPPEPKYFTHIVRSPGETFMAIARWYTGNGDNWKRIAQANPDIEPRYMRIGTAIRIPEQIMTTRQPMPNPARPGEKASKSKVVPNPAQPPEVELFGPIETKTPPAKPGFDEITPELEPLE
ncbi:MAG: LysM peptidoglycan-binding domain-containing protein [Desulfobacterales bacterium]|nr:LysM peptidoglycan-binding domain-containing protein [Desulfobacterales bacterium]